MNPSTFFTDYPTILSRIDEIQVDRYARTRNFLDGDVSRLSPFLTHGIISPKGVLDHVLKQATLKQAEKFAQELAWREYYQRVWQNKGDAMFEDLRHPQDEVDSPLLPTIIREAQTGIHVIDHAITELKTTGYMHNHARMWTASLACNIAQTHWKEPARWLYYHLLDGDLASNSLSWQWTAGSFSNKKYYANQENLNKFSKTTQTGTVLDVSYEEIASVPLPAEYAERQPLTLTNEFPKSTAAPLTNADRSALLYSIWNLDPEWQTNANGRRILWIEPSKHTAFPLSPQRWAFVQHWAEQISGLEIFVGEAADLFPEGSDFLELTHREHPLCQDWPGTKDSREWMHPHVTEYYPSFFKYWKLTQRRP